MKDLKYLAAFTIPAVAFISLSLKGYYTFLTPIYAFIVLPILEILLPENNEVYDPETIGKKAKNPVFDWLLLLNIPIVYCILVYAVIIVYAIDLRAFELIGITLSTGIVLGVNGINVGHELGHRQGSWQRFLGKLLLLPSLYMHFYVEHNFGHHLHVATKEDPATAKYNQNVYAFWVTSIFGQYFSAWRIQLKLLKQQSLSFFSIKNDMFWYIFIQLGYLFVVYFFFSFHGLLFSVSAAIVGMLLLETVNYIEHYGLVRKKTNSGRYERVREIHSWNSNHVIGRIVLYELTRHSDHHYKSSKKYQVLECHEESPQMPFGYPTSMVLSLFPFIWFKIMNKRIPKQMISQ